MPATRRTRSNRIIIRGVHGLQTFRQHDHAPEPRELFPG